MSKNQAIARTNFSRSLYASFNFARRTPIEEGLDVPKILKITKYESPIPAQLAGTTKGLFPSFIPKTDETRGQILRERLEDLEEIR